jgi:hypothetical protein
MRCARVDDLMAARSCALMAADLAAALAAADDWRRAACGVASPSIFSSVEMRALARKANAASNG